MIPIYNAIGFVDELKGGATYPWVITVLVEGQLEPYVVKLYKRDYVYKYFVIASEVYSSILAEAFGLGTPKPALIKFSEEFLNTLTAERKESLSGKNSEYKFGCQFIKSGSFQYVETLRREDFKGINIELIYAFDNLIKNGDRTKEKPNFLWNKSNLHLIDHERTFVINERTLEDFNNSQWVYWQEQHIFYNILKSYNLKEKSILFENFKSLLNNINFAILEPYYEQLLGLNLVDEERNYWINEYLCTVQQNKDKYVNILRSKLC